ncbi:rap guanine nucleotide exchange factor 6-like isoform X1 [Brachionus plicatilis]|uniref:Rap guanine nucleotide exchange factor 6-like isoform X1 n=1 Tax=Brachionus plicatilis TaxID=10195 RepID=A0A3M7RKK1_BRAPC|nr:rap guanine nucleotide exchange factor 6-like isoform X1 [Brachionus plicatilis]
MTSKPFLSFLECVSKLPDNRTENDSSIHSMSHIIRLKKYNKNNAIFQTGELIANWFILFSGLIKIGDQLIQPIAKFGRKTHFQNFRSTDSIAIEESQILIIDYQDVEIQPHHVLPNVAENSGAIFEVGNTENISQEAENISNNQEDDDEIIVLSDDNSNSQPNDQKENEFPKDAEIVCLSDEENKKCSETNQSESENDKDDLECIELYSIDKKFPLNRSDFDLDDQQVMDRWRIKKRADPNVNLSMSNYRLRVFGDQGACYERKFKPNIFFDESLIETELTDEEKIKLDREALEQKFKSYSSKFNQIIENYEALLKQNAEILDQKYQKNLNEILHHFSNEKDKLVENNENWYQNELNNGAQSQKCKAERALRDLFDSGCYIKGKFSEYLILETMQPRAKRRDVIYEYYYDKNREN